MQELTNKTLLELKALCREYSCFKGYSSFTKKSDLIDFMANRITTLAKVTGVAMPVPVPVSEVTISGFVPTPTPAEPIPFEEEEPEPDEWVDPDDQLLLAAASCPHCNGSEVAVIGESQEVWRCSRCHAIGWTPDLVDENGHCCPDPDSSKEYENKLRWWRERARYALEQAAVKALKVVRPTCPCKDFADLVSEKLHREILKADLDFSFHFHQALDKQIKAAYPFSSQLTPILMIWREEGGKLIRELGDCIHTPLSRPNLLICRSKVRVAIAKDGEDDRRGSDPRRSAYFDNAPEPGSGADWNNWLPDPDDYAGFKSFEIDFNYWVSRLPDYDDDVLLEELGVTAKEFWNTHYYEKHGDNSSFEAYRQ